MMRSDWGAFSHSAINLRTNTVAAAADGDGAGRDLRLRVDHPPNTHSKRRCGHWLCESWQVPLLQGLNGVAKGRIAPRMLPPMSESKHCRAARAMSTGPVGSKSGDQPASGSPSLSTSSQPLIRKCLFTIL